MHGNCELNPEIDNFADCFECFSLWPERSSFMKRPACKMFNWKEVEKEENENKEKQ